MNVTVKMAVAAAAIMASGNAFADVLTYEKTLNVTAPIETCTLENTNGNVEKSVEVGENMADPAQGFGSGQIEIVFSGVTLTCDDGVVIDMIKYERSYSQTMIDEGMDGTVTLGGTPLDEIDDATGLLPIGQQVPLNTRFRAAGFEAFEDNVIPEGQYVQTNTFELIYQ